MHFQGNLRFNIGGAFFALEGKRGKANRWVYTVNLT